MHVGAFSFKMSALLRRCISDYKALCHHFQQMNRMFLARSYAKKIASKVSAQAAQKTVVTEVESDPKKLLNYCCGANIFIEGSDPEIKPDSEYPEWLWTLRTERGGQNLSELDSSTSVYWKRLSRMTQVRDMRVRKRLQKLKELQFAEEKK